MVHTTPIRLVYCGNAGKCLTARGRTDSFKREEKERGGENEPVVLDSLKPKTEGLIRNQDLAVRRGGEMKTASREAEQTQSDERENSRPATTQSFCTFHVSG